MNLNDKIIFQIRDVMHDHHVSVADLAKRAGITRQALNRTLRGDTALTFKRFEQLCKLLSVRFIVKLEQRGDHVSGYSVHCVRNIT